MNLGAIGNGIGGFMAGYDKERQAAQQRETQAQQMQMNRLTMQQFMLKQKQDQESDAIAWPGILGS
jgi:hypothetical protein